MTYKYIAGRLGLANETLAYSLDTSVVYPIVRKIEQEAYLGKSEYVLPCLSSLGVKRNARIGVKFYREGNDVLIVYMERIYNRPRHTYGMIHLFFFDEKNNIKQVFNTTWIE